MGAARFPLMSGCWRRKHPWHFVEGSQLSETKLTNREERLHNVLPFADSTLFFSPDISELAVIGNSRYERPILMSPCFRPTIKPSPRDILSGESENNLSDTETNTTITPRECEIQVLDDEYGGPSLLLNGMLLPRVVRMGTNFEVLSSPSFEFYFEVRVQLIVLTLVMPLCD